MYLYICSSKAFNSLSVLVFCYNDLNVTGENQKVSFLIQRKNISLSLHVVLPLSYDNFSENMWSKM